MSVLRARMAGVGACLPEKVITNHDLEKFVETSDSWIRERTGICQRYVAGEGEMTSDLACKAARAALSNADMTVSDVDAVVLATATPDNTFPATATKVQAALGMTHGFAFDVSAVCSGFLYALTVSDSLIRAGNARRVLVIGAETFSRILDWKDRNTCVLFGDGAGAIILEATNAKDPGDRGVLNTHLRSDGRFYDFLYVNGGASCPAPDVGVVVMNGREVFRHAVTNLVQTAQESLKKMNLSPKDLDWLVPHQANIRIIDSTSKKLGIPSEKVIRTVDRHANTSAASIPLALEESIRYGKISQGDLVLLDAMGGGFTWGSVLLRI